MAKKDFQLQLQLLPAELRERFANEQKEKFDSVVFTCDAMQTPFFKSYREFCMMFETPASLGISQSYFLHLMTAAIETFYLSDMAVLCQASERRTPHQYLSVTGGDFAKLQGYADFLACFEIVTAEVNKLAEPISAGLMNKMQSLKKLQQNNPGRKILA